MSGKVTVELDETIRFGPAQSENLIFVIVHSHVEGKNVLAVA